MKYILLGLQACLSLSTASRWSSQSGGRRSAVGGSLNSAWYLQAPLADSAGSTPHVFSQPVRCEEPFNLPQQFMDWFRESQSDPVMLAFMSDITTSYNPIAPVLRDSGRTNFDNLIVDADYCKESPSTDPDSKLMDRALCPWEWRVNRDENREPKLISEAQCQCKYSRGSQMAECVPIRREFPVLKRVKCDDQGRYQYHKAYETVTVGCHSVMVRVHKASVPAFFLNSKGNT